MKKKLWGGRFKKEMHPLLKCFSYSLAEDFELLEAELCVNEAWVKMLGRAGLISKAEAAKLVKGLKALGKDLGANGPHFNPPKALIEKYEDVHTLVQSSMEKKFGAVGKKLHTGRSRNDLVVTSTRIYLKKKALTTLDSLRKVQLALVKCAKRAGTVPVAGLTHLRKGQPVLLAHQLLAYVEMFQDDAGRIEDAYARMDVLPLGSAALAGSSLPLDQKFLAKELGFSRVSTNSLAAVSDRAFITEFLAALSILWMHLSRLAEDFVLWNSEFFGYVELDDAFSTGSSLMPQKKNPDVFELIRGRSGVIFGHLQALLTIQKGLPLSYNRDLQEDKPGLFDAVRKTGVALDLLVLTIDSTKFNEAQLRESVQDEGLYATDILEYLVKKGTPFSEAHQTVGALIRYAADERTEIRELPVGKLKKFSRFIDEDIYDLIDPDRSVGAKQTAGSTHPDRVRTAIARWEKALKKR